MVGIRATFFFFIPSPMITHLLLMNLCPQRAGVILRVPRIPGTLAFLGQAR
jgi:hypothetical protein